MENFKKPALGRGLSSLIPTYDALEDLQTENASDPKITYLNLDNIIPNPKQPRKHIETEALEELSESIKQHGILQPIIVRYSNNKYTIVAGERRWRAATLAGLNVMPCIIKNISDKDIAELALVENIQREDLSPLEEARAYLDLMDNFGYSYEDIALKISKSRSYVVNAIRLLKLPQDVQDLVQSGKISMGHAKAIMNHADPSYAANIIVRDGLSVRNTEAMQKKKTANTNKSASSSDAEIEMLERSVTQSLGLQVKIDMEDTSKGSIKISFSNLNDLDDILNRLAAKI